MTSRPNLSPFQRLSQALTRFRSGEDGALIIFSLFMFILILWLGGMSVDLMRFETTRTKLQGTVDRATLAAADIDQTMPPADVVRDYFEKAGMSDFLKGDPIIEESFNYRVVTVSAEAKMPLFFYDIPRIFSDNFKPGVSTLTVGATSTAEERVSDVEVSLVMDVSESMSWGSKMTNLRDASRDFVTTVLANNDGSGEGLVTLSLVPYASVVNPGSMIANEMNINRNHTFSNCLQFPDAVFSDTAIDLSATYEHDSHWDNDNDNDWDVYLDKGWCFEGEKNAIVPFTDNEAALHTAIWNLVPEGATAIDLGLKWGVGLLDPSTRTLVNEFAGQSDTGVPGIAAGRPYDHGTGDSLKVVVLMSDGENSDHWDYNERFRSGTSYLWIDMNDDPTKPLNEVAYSDISIQINGVSTPYNFWDDRFFWNGYSSVWADSSYLDRGRIRNYPNGFDSYWHYATTGDSYTAVSSGPGVGLLYGGRVRNATWQELLGTWEYRAFNNAILRDAYNSGYLPHYQGNSGHPYYVDLPGWVDTEPGNIMNYTAKTGHQANIRMATLCNEAKSKGIIIYAVAFEAPYIGQRTLSNCASSPSHYFDVEGTDISAAFSAIASDIRALKLTR